MKNINSKNFSLNFLFSYFIYYVKANYTYKFRLYPNKEQKILLAKHFGCTRSIYNIFLARRKEQYLKTNKNNNFVEDCKELTTLKQNLPWLKEVNSQSLQHAIKHLDDAYGNFFYKRAKFPKFKNKHDKQSFRIPQNIKLKNNKLIIPKFREGIKCVIHQKVNEKISFCTISKNKVNQYYCTLTVEKEIKPLKPNNKEIGIDLGIKNLIIDSNGNEYKNIKPLKTLERKLKRKQRKLSNKRRKTTNKESKKIKKAQLKLAKIHQKIKNIRQDYLHKITKKLIDENQVICIENLAVKNMMKNHKLAKAIVDCSWGELVRQLLYKAIWYGRKIIQVDRFFPSSKTCNNCFHIKQDLKLKDRKWTCVNCNAKHDRDINAAKNILIQGCKINTVGTTEIKARGLRKQTEKVNFSA